MKAQKALSVFATVSLLGLSVACNDRYSEGLADGKKQGYTEGYSEGYADGDADGFSRAQAYFASADYQKGFNDGKAQGITLGYNQGYNAGKTDGINQGYNSGYNTGYDDGYYDGYYDGDANGYADGVNDGYDLGYDDGFYDGYDSGYYDGYYGLSVGKTKRMKGYADVLSAFHNELIDYSKITKPVETKHGLAVNGHLLLSETDSASKDVLKRAAVVEQYVVFEMAKQVKSKFGLSDERSLKIAKASNHFRKYASKRALTTEDTNAYAEEILGANFDEIADAYTDLKKGNLSSFNRVIEKAADKNETSPEKMATIVSNLFL